MGFADRYLQRPGQVPFLKDPPSANLRYIVVIPVYAEPDLFSTLNVLQACQRPRGHVEVIIVVNAPQNASLLARDINSDTLSRLPEWIRTHEDHALRFFVINRTQYTHPDSGVGMARKMGMDEALRRFNQLNKPDGCILSFDADSTCDTNYFTAIEEVLRQQPTIKGFDIYFEHPVQGTEHPQRLYQAMTGYELHLRYTKNFLQLVGFPHAFYTLGSCFGVRADVYALQGGMNKRKAGEDFYFLNKIIPLGDFMTILTTRVIPSPRLSDRVPFGTGPALQKWVTSNQNTFNTYAPESFLNLRPLFSGAGQMFRMSLSEVTDFVNLLPDPLQSYLRSHNFADAVTQINRNTSHTGTFVNRFFRWFDAFRVIKFLNFAHAQYFSKTPVISATEQLLKYIGLPFDPKNPGEFYYLEILRRMDKEGIALKQSIIPKKSTA